ncbi:zinc-binding dehydrogenase [Actinopolymorpha sp. B11F2]|uniref:zinc-binding dehydrogenase n=1 Tax=Actinopolymorpha sp. B11F2 TaxID=3160862 RepID=UPI0032E4B619
MATCLVLTAPRTLEFAVTEHRPLRDGEVRLRTLVSGISHGTELNLYRGTAPFATRSFDPQLRVFVPSEESSRTAKLGYDLVGEVVEVGPGVDGVAVGDILHTGQAHQEEPIVALDAHTDFYPPCKLPRTHVERGLFVSLASVALQAVHDARIKVGDAVVVSGAGVIGQLVAQLARMNGADPVAVVEPHAERRNLAVRLGAAEALDPTAGDQPIGYQVKKALGNRGADIAIETSGTYPGLHGAIASVGVGGTVVAAGFYQGGAADLRLGEEWHHNRPNLVSSMGVWGCPHRDHPLWNRARIARTVVDLIYSDRLVVEPLLTDRVPFRQAPKAYERLDNDPASALKIALTY